MAYFGGLQTIFHEMVHVGQIENLYTGKSFNENAFRTALETVVNDFSPNFYTDNYDKLFRENQADLVGLDETKKLIKAYNKTLYNHCSNVIENKIKYYGNNMYSKENQSILGKKTFKTNLLLSLITEKSIQKDPTLLEKYPILKKAYNLDGTKKNIIQLIEDRDNEISNTKDTEILDNLYYAITDYRLENAKVDKDDIITYVETTGRNDEFIEKMFESILVNSNISKEKIKGFVETLHKLANSVKIEKNNNIQSPHLKDSIREESTDIKQDEKNQVSQNVQWMNAMKNFSNRVTEIEGYAKKQGEIVQEISMSERQKEVQKEDNLNHEDIEK